MPAAGPDARRLGAGQILDTITSYRRCVTTLVDAVLDSTDEERNVAVSQLFDETAGSPAVEPRYVIWRTKRYVVLGFLRRGTELHLVPKRGLLRGATSRGAGSIFPPSSSERPLTK